MGGRRREPRRLPLLLPALGWRQLDQSAWTAQRRDGTALRGGGCSGVERLGGGWLRCRGGWIVDHSRARGMAEGAEPLAVSLRHWLERGLCVARWDHLGGGVRRWPARLGVVSPNLSLR